ncbi:MAG: hypothetical protein WHX52_22530 [Anaerolineae bacterium]
MQSRIEESYTDFTDSMEMALTLVEWFPPIPSACVAPDILYAAPNVVGSGDCSPWANTCTLQTALTGAASGDEMGGQDRRPLYPQHY